MHTPGPWEFECYGGPSGPLIFHVDPRDENNGVDICEISFANGRIKESLANARLICAAPELLRLLEELEQACTDDGVRGMDNLLVKARQIVKQAKGEK